MADCEVDLFRDTWVRYLGYANEVGESFRSLVPVKVVRASYAVAFAYAFADTADKSWKMFQKDGRPRKVLIETGDALLWQTLASVVIPGLTINRICSYTNNFLQKNAKRIPLTPRSLLTVGAGLVSIPFIVHPIDNGVTLFMNITYRRLEQQNISKSTIGRQKVSATEECSGSEGLSLPRDVSAGEATNFAEREAFLG
ncbi:unnamed protein product [Leptosia nina]|uniref:Mitochondrial fission process protein 1 n=1 Tax=Leptosia nina TaxID=320188 RepID=A0AAV1IY87_9NEOP